MRVRGIVRSRKTIGDDLSKWTDRDLPPRNAPIYPRSKPMRAGWKWRSSKVRGHDDTAFILLAEANSRRDNWKAILIVQTDGGHSVVARFEHHGSHPGLHIHADCNRAGIELGAGGLDGLARIPKAGGTHRRANAWTESSFWEASKRFFHVEEEAGPLFSQ